MRTYLLAFSVLCLFVVGCTAEAEGRGRLLRRRTHSYTSSYSAAASIYATPQQAAEAKAAMLARRGYGFHPGGGFGGGFREGWGFSTRSAEAARWGTCFGNQCNSARGAAQAYSARAGGWFAINIW